MELAYNIISHNNSKSEKKEKVVNDFKKLKLNDMMRNMDINDFKNSKKDTILAIIGEFTSVLFNSNDLKLPDILLSAYCITNYSNNMFTLKTCGDSKLINAANKLVHHLENIDGISPNENFMDSLDYYYILYKKWQDCDSLKLIDNIFSDLMIECRGLTINKSKNKNINNSSIVKINELINKLFEINMSMSVQIVLNKYEIFNDLHDATDTIWKNIESKINDHNNHILIIIIAELRVKLIPKLVNAQDKKDVYYDIDIDQIIKYVRNNEFSFDKLWDIIELFTLKLISLDKNFNNTICSLETFFKNGDYKSIILIFRKMFDFLMSYVEKNV